MKIFQRVFCLICTLALLFSAVPTVMAQATPTLYFTNATLTVGGSSAYCYLKMNNAENISAMDYRIIYDAENLEFANIYNVGFTSQSDVTVSVNSEEPGVIHVTLISQNGLNGSNYLNLIYFKAKETAKVGRYPISVVVTDIYNSALETVTATTQTGTITVKEGTQTVKSASFFDTVSYSTVQCGENFEYTLGGGILNELSAGTFTFSYDAEKLHVESVSPSSLMTVYDINDSHEGIIKLSFVSEKAIASYNYLVTVKFSAIAPGKADIGFVPSDLYDSSFAGMTGNELTKSVTITEPEVVVDYPDLRLDVPEAVDSDKEFEVQVVLEGDSKVRAGDFAVGYDTDVLECLGISGGTVSGAWIVADKNYSGGQTRFSLMSNVDLTEDAVLATVRFKAKENNDSKSLLTVSGADVYDGSFNAITLEYVASDVKAVRPEYTVNFYDLDGTTLLFTQKVMSGNSAIPPKTEEIRKQNGENHIKFSGWDKDYSAILANADIIAVYVDEPHTIVTQSGTAATCTEAGMTDGKYCVVCNEVLAVQSVIPAKGHTEEILPAVEPTHTSTGLTEGKKCSVCGKILLAQEEIPMLEGDLPGDFNDDDKVTIADVLIIIKAVLNGTPLENGDMNGDDGLSLIDVLRVMKLIIK